MHKTHKKRVYTFPFIFVFIFLIIIFQIVIFEDRCFDNNTNSMIDYGYFQSFIPRAVSSILILR